MREALAAFDKQGYTSIVIDLRSNPGGLLTGVVDVADFFFDRGTLDREHPLPHPEREPGLRGARQARSCRATSRSWCSSTATRPRPRRSSPAPSRTYGRATIMGEKSYGKGSVQEVVPIETGGFRLTTARYYTPSGTSIDQVGIEPDRRDRAAGVHGRGDRIGAKAGRDQRRAGLRQGEPQADRARHRGVRRRSSRATASSCARTASARASATRSTASPARRRSTTSNSTRCCRRRWAFSAAEARPRPRRASPQRRPPRPRRPQLPRRPARAVKQVALPEGFDGGSASGGAGRRVPPPRARAQDQVRRPRPGPHARWARLRARRRGGRPREPDPRGGLRGRGGARRRPGRSRSCSASPRDPGSTRSSARRSRPA